MIGYYSNNNDEYLKFDSHTWKQQVTFDSIDAIRAIIDNNLKIDAKEQSARIHEILNYEREFLESIEKCIPGIFYVYSQDYHLIRWNSKHECLTRYSKEELLGMDFYSWFDQKDKERVIAALEIMLSTGYAEVEAVLNTKEGMQIPMIFNMAKVKIGDQYCFTGFGIDISERKRNEEITGNLLFYDNLTGLPNRIKAFHMVEEHIKNHPDPNHKDALLFVDIDNFKFINDTFGHLFGDELLKKIADKLKTLDSDHIQVARFEGDEFFVFIQDTNEDEIKEVSTKILSLINDQMEIQGRLNFISASIGIAIYPDHATNFEELMQFADTAINKAKYAGKDRYEFYDICLHEQIKERVELTGQLITAIEKNEFTLHYQPQLDMKSKKIIGLEALIRWNHPKQGMISPAIFIPIAEESGLIIDIGDYVLRETASFVKRLHDFGYSRIKISVNVSVKQMNEVDFVQNILGIMKEYEISPSSIILEVTESILIESFELIKEKLVRLKQEGFHISLDDFGTGYSSLTYLKTLPINCLKIDKSFIEDIATNEIDKGLTVSIIQIAHQLGLSVVAEGVEQVEQYHYLYDNQCDYIQGYYYSKPLPEAAVVQLIRENHQAAM